MLDRLYDFAVHAAPAILGWELGRWGDRAWQRRKARRAQAARLRRLSEAAVPAADAIWQAGENLQQVMDSLARAKAERAEKTHGDRG